MDSGLEAGGKPSTWFPPGGLVEQIWNAIQEKSEKSKRLSGV